MPSTPSTVEHVSDTARWVAMYRAFESERPDAIFRDPYARRLAGPRGEAIVRELPGGPQTAWTIVVRTAVLDELILREVQGGVDCVLNLAAGLDARPYRLALPASLRWVEVDFPGMVETKNALLASDVPNCRLERIACDLSDGEARRALFARISGESQRVLVVTEGLLMYLTAEQVRSLALDLRAAAPFESWLLDNYTRAVLAVLRGAWGRTLQNAEMKFAVDEPGAFFRPLGWDVADYRPTITEALRLRREPPFGFVVRALSRLARLWVRAKVQGLAGYVLLRRA